MNRKQSVSLACSALLLGQLAWNPPPVQAGDFDLKSSSDTDSKGSTNLGEGNFTPKKFTLTFDSRVGYDDNSLAQADTTVTTFSAAGVPSRRHVDGTGSTFLNFDLGASYTASTSRSSLILSGDVGVSYFFDRPGRNYDVNGGVSAAFSYKLTPRLFLQLSSFNSYVSQGDYGASNLTNFNGAALGGVRAPGTTDQRNGDYFYTSESLELTLQLSSRISLVSGYSLVAFAYDDEPYSTIDDRVEQYFSEEFRYLLLPNLTLAADYRLGYVDYFDVSNDSLTNFIGGGFDYVFSPRLRGSIRAGAEIRIYTDAPGNETSPYAEANLSYSISRFTNINFLARYGIEEGGLSSDVTNSDTIRMGLSLNQQVTAKVSAYLSFYFTHSYFDTPTGNLPNFNEDSFDVALGARYAINRHVSLEVGYTHTTVDSEVDFRAYQRNRVFGGVRLAF